MSHIWKPPDHFLVRHQPDPTRETLQMRIQTDFLVRILKSQKSVQLGAVQNGGVRFFFSIYLRLVCTVQGLF